MLKNKFYILIFIISLSLTGCDDYLSELPDNRTIIDSPEKISALITGAYPDGNYMLMAELMSDNAREKYLNGGGELDLQMYQWQDSNLEDQDTPVGYWNSCYEAISQANEALAAIKNNTLGSSNNLDAQQGEALLARAYAHFMLVNFWAKNYDPNTASSDLGVPYVTEPETVLIKKYKRNTVQEVYDLIEQDLLIGLSLVKNEYKEPKFHFTKEAGYAFAARFYLYKGEWDEVIKFTNKVISNPTSEIRDDESYRNLSYSETARTYSGAIDRNNLLITSTSSVWARGFASSRFGLSSSLANELFFGGSGNPFNKPWSYRVFGNDQVFNLPKFDEYFKVTNQSAGTGLPYVGVVLFDKDEALLNRAEAYAMKENYNASLRDLTDFLSLKTRGFDPNTDQLDEATITSDYPAITGEYTPYYTLNSTQTSFVKAISEFKRRNYYHEGLRWFDIKRFKLEVEHLFNNSPILLAKDDNRKQLQIPLSAQNFGVTPNPR